MSTLQAILLGLIQGLTEFLPISSSGHLALGQHLFRVNDPSVLSFDVYVHFGTLISVCVIFWRDILEIIRSTWAALVSWRLREAYRTADHVRLGVAILIGSIPAAVVGLMFRSAIEQAFADPKQVAVNLVLTGLILFLTRLARPGEANKLGIAAGFVVGIAQAVAILPGISRSGTTMSTALFLKFPPVLAARFSFLLSIPVIAGAALLESKNVVTHGMETGFAPVVFGTISAAVTGYIAIKLLLRVMEKGKFSWFAFYCLALGVAGILFI
ncbi:MAG: undecaprenyl-diphosphate phosphatase [Ignavibacteria bacterium]|nr:undecaprenyl-diphosphate phosphatase [Ignavibacteria bacterium]